MRLRFASINFKFDDMDVYQVDPPLVLHTPESASMVDVRVIDTYVLACCSSQVPSSKMGI